MVHLYGWAVRLGLAVAFLAGGMHAGEGGDAPALPAPAAPAWPASRTGLLFCMESTHFKTPIFALDKDGNEILAYQLTARDKARYDRNFGLALSGGSFVAERVEEHLLDELKKSGAFTLEAFLTPPDKDFVGPGEIVSFGSSAKDKNFGLQQKTDKLLLRRFINGPNPETLFFPLCALKDSQPFQITLTLTGGTVTCYLNGTEASRQSDTKFTTWESAHLVFGDTWTQKYNWPGALEGVALFSRALSADEVKADYDTYSQKVKPRKPPVVIQVQGKLIAKTKMPNAQELGPYSRALVAYDYDVEKVLSGEFADKTIRVAHFGVMDRKVLPAIDQRALGDSVSMKLEKFGDNPQLESEMMCNDLPVSDQAVYYDVEP